MREILISGSTGFLGTHLTEALSKQGYKVNVLVRAQSNLDRLVCKDKMGIHLYDGTLSSLIDVFSQKKFDLVIHLATKYVAEHHEKDVDDLIEANITFGMHLLECMKIYQVKQFINVGTHWDRMNGEAYNPVNLYAATKKAFEVLATHYVKSEGLSLVNLKIYDTYGPRDQRQKLFDLFRKSQMEGTPLLMSPGEQVLGFLYIDDVVAGILRTIDLMKEKSLNETYYLCPEEWYSLKETARIYEEVSGKPIHIKWGARPYRTREVMMPYKGECLPLWKPSVGLREGLKRLMND